MNSIPIIAFAPITNNWFGLLNPFSKMAIAAVLCFFPVLINTVRGLTSVNPRSIELMRSYAAGNRPIAPIDDPYQMFAKLLSWIVLRTRSDTTKDIEILVLRHQLAVLQRRTPRPRTTWTSISSASCSSFR